MTLLDRYPLAFVVGEVLIEHLMITTWLWMLLPPRFSKKKTWLLHYASCCGLNLLTAVLPVQFAMVVLYIGMAAFTCLYFRATIFHKLFAIGLAR